ncbi:hypothetical protein M9Y10_041514 [Tritrichomonas musculus]|uniref:Uncharacterized protein n=1 Tax=Tritrichomonas musculus TaxID=1915356 RepID=A0ABR2K4P5_9EUKA
MSSRKSTGRIQRVPLKKRSSKSVPPNSTGKTNSSIKKRSESPQIEKGNAVIQILTTLQSEISSLPIFASKVNVLTNHLSSILDLANRYKGNIARSTVDFWSKWEKFSKDFTIYMNELTCEHCVEVTVKQLNLLEKYIQNIRSHPPHQDNSGYAAFTTSLENLTNDYYYLRDFAQTKFSEEVESEEEFVQNSRQIIQPVLNLIKLLDQPDYTNLFQLCITSKKDAITLKANFVHALELILESIRGLTNYIRIRIHITEKFSNAETEIGKIIPKPKKSLAFNPSSSVNGTITQKKKAAQEESKKKKILSRREIALILDERRNLLKKCGLPITIAEDKDKIIGEIQKRRKVLQQRELTARSDAQKNEIAKNREALNQLEQRLNDELKEDDVIEEKITALSKQIKKMNESSDIINQIEALKAERDELLDKKQKAEKRFNSLRNEDEKRDSSNISEDVSSLEYSCENLKDQLSNIKNEQRRLFDDMIRARAQNDILANGQNAIIENASLREQKMKLLNNIQQTREETELLKCFKNKADHLAFLPESNLMSNDQLMNEYNAAVRANTNLTRQRDSLKSSLQSLERRREQLISNSAKSELLASKYNSEKIEKDMLSEIEQVSNEYNKQKKKWAYDQLNRYVAQFELLKSQTDSKILQLRKEQQENRKSKIDIDDYNNKTKQESEQEIEIMKQEIKQVENSTREIKRLMLRIQTQIVETLAKRKAINVQKLMLKQKNSESELTDQLDEVSGKNKELRLRYDEAKLQLKEIDESLTPQSSQNSSKIDDYQYESDDDLNLLHRLESIESKLSVVFEAQQAAVHQAAVDREAAIAAAEKEANSGKSQSARAKSKIKSGRTSNVQNKKK